MVTACRWSWETDPSAAIALARRDRIDLAILDMRMPQMNGLALHAGAAQPIRLTLPVMIMTGFGSMDSAVEALNLGRDRLRQQADERRGDPRRGAPRAGAAAGRDAGDAGAASPPPAWSAARRRWSRSTRPSPASRRG